MNYLAHLYLAADTPESLLGNLLGDFRKGLDLEALPSAIVDGIQQHQRVDIFTDTHPIVRQAKRLVHPDRRRFAGILLDVFYDHYLSVHWSQYSQVPLRAFIDRFYTVLVERQDTLPEYLGRAVPSIIEQDWLGCYGTTDGIALTLLRMSNRMRRKNPIADGIHDLIENYDAFDRSFLVFFPALMDYANKS
jgi:acyl carrier protein phosphodiesterase